MSTIIIGGGDGHLAITRLVAAYPQMTADQQAKAKDLLQTFTADVESLLRQCDGDPPRG